MNVFLFYITIALLVAISLFIGRKTEVAQTTEDYFLGNRGIKFFQLTLTFLATQLGGGVIMGTIEAAKDYGLGALLYGFGLSLGLIILSLGVGSAFRRLEVVTIPEIFEKVYKAPRLRQISSIISISSLFLILVAICLSTKKLLWSVGVESELFFIAFWFAATYYTVMGGFKAVVKTDAFQVGFILVVFVITLFYLFLSDSFILPQKVNLLPSSDKNFPWFAWLISPMFFVIIGQDMGQRCFSGHSEKTVSRACFWAGIILFLCTLLPCYMGLTLKSQDSGDTLLIAALESLKNPYLMSLFCAALLMAILSTADSLLCAIASHLAEDFSFVGFQGEEKKLFYSRIVTFTIGFLSLVFASFATQIISLMILAYKLCVSTLFIPILFSVLFKRVSRNSAAASMLAGFITLVFVEFYFSFAGKEILPLVTAALAFLFFREKTELSSL